MNGNDSAAHAARESGVADRAAVHLLPQFPYFGGRKIVGGYSAAVLALANRQAAEGDRVCIVARTIPETPAETGAGVPITTLGDAKASAGSFLGTLVFMARAVTWSVRNRRTIWLVHLHAGYAEYLLLALLVRVLARVPVVATVYCPVLESGWRSRAQVLVVRLARRWVTLTGMSANVARSLSVPSRAPDHPRVTRPVLDLQWFTEPPSTAVANGRARPLRVLFVGNTSPTKGLDLLLEALALLSDDGVEFSLTVTTELDRSSPTAEIEQLIESIRALGLEDSVELLQIVDEIRETYRGHDVHVAPFRTTQGPSDYFMATLEAMASRTAVVASRLPGMSEVIRDGKDGLLFQPGDSQDLARCLQTLTDSETREAMAQRGCERLWSFMNPHDCLHEFERTYRDATVDR